MHFFFQNDNLCLDKEIYDLKFLLNNTQNRYIHDYDDISNKDIKIAKFGKGINVPVGSLEFVGSFLENVKGSSYMKPIEIPDFLQKKEYLKREYKICKFKDLPKTGTYFIKDASFLKCGQPNMHFMPFINDTLFKSTDDWEEHDYVCSEVLPIIDAEYRVLVNEDNIVGVQFYSGTKIIEETDYDFGFISPYAGILCFPDGDMLESVIKDIKAFRVSGGIFPKSYTIDVAVTPRGTVLLELHNFVSCGTYGFCDKVLINMYSNGIDFELQST